MKVTAIFDIGRTNKKCFLFDEDYQVVYKTYSTFSEIEDEDGFPCEDLGSIGDWLKETLRFLIEEEEYDVRAINFSTYGASLVHLDEDGIPLTPLYNYLKPISEDILTSFYRKYGDKMTVARETASPPLAMLNSGLQLYWLKYTRPDIFKKIRWSLHLPQYISYLFTGIAVSEYTSIGCHTGLWDYAQNDYHRWVYQEEINRILPPIVETGTSNLILFCGKKIKAGVGAHDSSAALLPYFHASRDPFLLISTGTWSIALNPFNTELLTDEELKHDCLNFMRPDGKPVKAARLFLGHEYELQLEKLKAHFAQNQDAQKVMNFDERIYSRLIEDFSYCFAFESLGIEREQPQQNLLERFQNFTTAYHQLMLELVELQVLAAKRAIGTSNIRYIYIDGGFAGNKIYVHLLGLHFEETQLKATQSQLGSALGAAMVIAGKLIRKSFLKKNDALKKV